MLRIKLIFLLILVSFSIQAETLKGVYEKYQSAYNTGDLKAAVKYAERAVTLGSTEYAPDSENALNLKFNLANAYLENKRYDKALKIYTEIYDKYESVFGEDSLETFELGLQKLISLGRTQSSRQASRYQRDFKDLMKRAKKLGEKYPEQALNIHFQFIKAAQSARTLGISTRSMTKYVENFEQKLLEEVGKKDVRTGEVQFYLAKLYRLDNKTSKSIEKFESVVRIFDEAADFSHPYELSSHANLVGLYEQKAKSDQATEHCVAIGKMTPWNDNIDPVPLFRKNPQYPVSAARASKEGWVKMAFDITPSGFVTNIHVLDSKGGNGFINASKEALSAWRYAPKFENGQVVTAEQQTVQLDFRLGN